MSSLSRNPPPRLHAPPCTRTADCGQSHPPWLPMLVELRVPLSTRCEPPRQTAPVRRNDAGPTYGTEKRHGLPSASGTHAKYFPVNTHGFWAEFADNSTSGSWVHGPTKRTLPSTMVLSSYTCGRAKTETFYRMMLKVPFCNTFAFSDQPSCRHTDNGSSGAPFIKDKEARRAVNHQRSSCSLLVSWEATVENLDLRFNSFTYNIFVFKKLRFCLVVVAHAFNTNT